MANFISLHRRSERLCVAQAASLCFFRPLQAGNPCYVVVFALPITMARAWKIDNTSACHSGRIHVIALASRFVIIPASIERRKGQTE